MPIVHDFETIDTTQWNGNTGDLSRNNDSWAVTNGSYAAKYAAPSGTTKVWTTTENEYDISRGDLFWVDIYYRVDQYDIYFAVQDANNWIRGEFDQGGDAMRLKQCIDGTVETLGDSSVSIYETGTVNLRFDWQSDGKIHFEYFVDGSNEGGVIGTESIPWDGGGIGIGAQTSSSQDQWADFWRIENTIDSPSNLSAADDPMNAVVNLSWTDNSEYESEFRIYRATSSGSSKSDYTQIATVGENTTSYTDTSVDAGTTYYYRVSAYESYDGESALSNEASASATPGPPSSISATVDADDQITVSFDDGGGAGSYEVEMDRNGTGFVSPAGGPSSITDDGSSSYSATYGPENSGGSPKDYGASVGLDSSFQFRVRSVSNGVTSDWASSGTVYTSPIPPYNPSVSRPSATEITFEFENRSDIVDSVEVEFREDEGSGYGTWNQSSATPATPGTTIDAPEDARFQFRLRSVGPDDKTSEWVYADYGNGGNVYFEDDFSSGDASAWDSNSIGTGGVTSTLASTFSAGDNTQSPETGGYAVEMGDTGWLVKNLGDLSGESDVHVRLRVQAASNDGAYERGDLWWYDGSSWQTLEQWGWQHDGQGWMEYHALVPDSYLSTDNRVQIGRDEGAGVDYIAFDEIVVSDILHEYTKPAAPYGLTLDASVEGEITASWTSDAAFLDNQDFLWKRSDGSYNVEYGIGTGESYTLSSLDDGEQYTIYVKSVVREVRNGEMKYNWWRTASNEESAVTFLPAPTNLTVDATSATSVDLSWTDNHDYGDTQVQYKPSDASTWTTFATVSRGTGAESITGLLNGEQYDARVVATTEHTTTEDA
ncbi:Fibronectin type III domain protein [Natrinema thermotolerans DSM 11552]|nr:Fibronectin type III domain protein [Natrinema thermotolerans DSM 11552]